MIFETSFLISLVISVVQDWFEDEIKEVKEKVVAYATDKVKDVSEDFAKKILDDKYVFTFHERELLGMDLLQILDDSNIDNYSIDVTQQKVMVAFHSEEEDIESFLEILYDEEIIYKQLI